MSPLHFNAELFDNIRARSNYFRGLYIFCEFVDFFLFFFIFCVYKKNVQGYGQLRITVPRVEDFSTSFSNTLFFFIFFVGHIAGNIDRCKHFHEVNQMNPQSAQYAWNQWTMFLLTMSYEDLVAKHHGFIENVCRYVLHSDISFHYALCNVWIKTRLWFMLVFFLRPLTCC